MVPRALFKKAKRTMIVILLITCLSGGSFFALLLFWPTEVYNVYGQFYHKPLARLQLIRAPGDDPVGIGIRSLPIGFGIIGGAAICLVLIPITKGRIRPLLIFFTALMTAGTGALAIASPHNLNTVYAILTLASLGVGGVIIPSSIIAQIACPDELIATVTAITLSIRYIGGAIAFAVYSNLFYHKVAEYAAVIVAQNTIVKQGMVNYLKPEGKLLIAHMVELAGNARLKELRDIIATNPLVLDRDSYAKIIASSQEAFALAYRWPYWVSISFGAVSFVLSFFVQDIGELMAA